MRMEPRGEPDIPIDQGVVGQIVLGDVGEREDASDKDREQAEERPRATVARKARGDAAGVDSRGERHQRGWSAAISPAKCSAQTLRLSFRVGVTSSSSAEKSRGRIVKRLTCSNEALSRFMSSTTRWIKARTSAASS